MHACMWGMVGRSMQQGRPHACVHVEENGPHRLHVGGQWGGMRQSGVKGGIFGKANDAGSAATVWGRALPAVKR